MEVPSDTMQCFECGNCREDVVTYYCTAKNEFVIKNTNNVIEKQRGNFGWKKGDPRYETRRRSHRGEEAKKIG